MAWGSRSRAGQRTNGLVSPPRSVQSAMLAMVISIWGLGDSSLL